MMEQWHDPTNVNLIMVRAACVDIYHWKVRIFGELWTGSVPPQYVCHFEAESTLCSVSGTAEMYVSVINVPIFHECECL